GDGCFFAIVLLDLSAICTASSRNSGEYLIGGATSSSFPVYKGSYWVPVRKPRGTSVKKLRAFNGDYIRAMGVEEFTRACRPWLEGESVPWSPEAYDPAVFAQVAPLVHTRIALLSEVVQMVDFLFLDEPVFDEAAWNKA